MARKLVGAIVQKITYNEFLPALLGPLAPSLASYAFDPSVDPQISNEFASFAYRLGHSMLSLNLALADQSGVFSSIPLRDAFFNPALFLENSLMVDHLIAGLIKTPAQEVDTKIIEDVRSFLFPAPNGQDTCLDLAALNIRRGRDHGILPYYARRVANGLSSKSSFDEIHPTREPEILWPPLSLLWMQLMLGSEPSKIILLEPVFVGELLGHVISDQFRRLMVGDHFLFLERSRSCCSWYERYHEHEDGHVG